MNKRSLVLVLFTATCSIQTCLAQSDSLAIKRYYEQNTIYWPGRRTYVKADKHYPLKNLRQEFEFSKEAKLEWREYRRDKRRALICLVVGETLLLGGVISDEPIALLTATGGAVVLLTMAVKYSNRSFAHLNRAVWVHNRDVLLR